MRLAGQIGYALCPQVARGAMLGPDQPVILHLLDIPPAQQSLEGVKMELIDAAFPLVHGVYSASLRLLEVCFDNEKASPQASAGSDTPGRHLVTYQVPVLSCLICENLATVE